MSHKLVFLSVDRRVTGVVSCMRAWKNVLQSSSTHLKYGINSLFLTLSIPPCSSANGYKRKDHHYQPRKNGNIPQFGIEQIRKGFLCQEVPNQQEQNTIEARTQIGPKSSIAEVLVAIGPKKWLLAPYTLAETLKKKKGSHKTPTLSICQISLSLPVVLLQANHTTPLLATTHYHSHVTIMLSVSSTDQIYNPCSTHTFYKPGPPHPGMKIGCQGTPDPTRICLGGRSCKLLMPLDSIWGL